MREFILYFREVPFAYQKSASSSVDEVPLFQVKLDEPIEVLELRDRFTKERLMVRAIVTANPQAGEEYDKVWLWEATEYRAREPSLWIKILGQVEEEEEEEVVPRARPSIRRRAGGLIRSLIEEAEEKERGAG
ncbi:MAG TPA: hypothetical protein VJ256_05210 [Dehalococcoidia bacterium]|nr:hypothetical protein [Dehalococcoidia bacterium]HLB29499.1 hypothetical protein [Dehalococcoidia bacterium]